MFVSAVTASPTSLLRVVTTPSKGARISSKPVSTLRRATCASWAAMLASRDLHGGLRGVDIGGLRQHPGLGRVGVLPGLGAGAGERRGPSVGHVREVAVGLGLVDHRARLDQRRLELQHLRLRLDELLVEVGGADPEQQVARLHVRADIDLALDDVAGRPRVEARRVEGLGGAGLGEAQGSGGPLGRGDPHGRRPGRGGRGGLAARDCVRPVAVSEEAQRPPAPAGRSTGGRGTRGRPSPPAAELSRFAILALGSRRADRRIGARHSVGTRPVLHSIYRPHAGSGRDAALHDRGPIADPPRPPSGYPATQQGPIHDDRDLQARHHPPPAARWWRPPAAAQSAGPAAPLPRARRQGRRHPGAAEPVRGPPRSPSPWRRPPPTTARCRT